MILVCCTGSIRNVSIMHRGTFPCAARNRARQLAEQRGKPMTLSPGLDLKIVGVANSVELLFRRHILSLALIFSSLPDV